MTWSQKIQHAYVMLNTPNNGEEAQQDALWQRRPISAGPAAGLTALRSVTWSQKIQHAYVMLNTPNNGEEAQQDAL